MTEETSENNLPLPSRGMRLAKQGGLHLLVWLVAFGLFAAADSWYAITGLGIASFLAVLTGVIAGFTTATLFHEWFHLLGAWFSGGDYEINAKPGLFVFDWTFASNSVKQFYTMSVAGSVGGAVGIYVLWSTVPTDTDGRAALLAAGIASFVYAAAIEWPVLSRTRATADPLAELSKISPAILKRSFLIASVTGWLCWALM